MSAAPKPYLKRGAILLVAFFLGGCGEDYPLVANGYPRTADISALDDHGFGNFAQPVPPKSCLLAFRAMPDISTMQVRVYIENEVDSTYSSAALAHALNAADFSRGVFVVDESGLRFQKGYECGSEIR
jgi:hypothetical protein